MTVTYFDSTTFNFCQDVDSVPVYFWINPCVYGDVQISASGNNLTANQSYSSNITVCSNVYPNTFLWSTGDTTQTISVNAQEPILVQLLLMLVVYSQQHITTTVH